MFSNPMYRLGWGSQSPLEATEYPLTRLTENQGLLRSLYRDNWIVQNVVGIVPDDMTRKWYGLSGEKDPQRLRQLRQTESRTGLRQSVNEGLRWGRLYGGAAGLMVLEGHWDRLEEPLKVEEVEPDSFEGLYVMDRWSGLEPEGSLVYDGRGRMTPEYYRVAGSGDHPAVRVHHSRMVRFLGRELPEQERIGEQYWGESEVESLYADVVKHNNVSANMAALTFRANVDTMEVQNLDQLLSMTSGEAQRRFWNTIQAQSAVQSNLGMRLVNKGDRLENSQYSFTGLRDVHEAMCLDLAGAARIPMTKLFGRSPAGMNATGESDLRNYYDYVDTLREGQLRPVLQQLLPVLAMSAWGEVPEGLEIVFPPLWTPSAKELAEIQERKAKTVRELFECGLLDKQEAKKLVESFTEEA